MLGSSTDPLLREIANIGGGAYYQTSNAKQLPRLFLDDIKVSTGERTVREEEFKVRHGSSGVISTDISSFPPVLGYVQTEVKQRANFELAARGNRTSEPLLASWSYGKGRSVAFTSDVDGRWSQYWIGWRKFHEFWSDILDSTRGERLSLSDKFDLRYFVERGALHFDLTIYKEGFVGDTTLK